MISSLQSILDIAKQAGDAIMVIYESDDFNVESKADNSPLTKADKAANDVICAGLEQLDEQYPIVSEENKLLDYSERKNYKRCWMVDPLDGTKEFIKRNGEFTVNIALIEDGTVIFGVVYAPVLDEMYYGMKSEGAFLIKNGEKTKLKVNDYSTKDKGLRIVCSRSHLNEGTSNFVKQYSDPELVSTGSSLKFLMMAKGEAEIYPRIAPTMEWDTAAAQIVLEEAGGAVYQFESGEPMAYNKENLLNPFFVATAKEV